MRSVIDFRLPRGEFVSSVKETLTEAARTGCVIPLPIHAKRDYDSPGIIASILSHIDCSKCDARCCRSNHGDTPIPVFQFEYDFILSKYGIKLPLLEPGVYGITPPCPLLVNGKCSCYTERPTACRFYPMQHGGSDQKGELLSLDSVCPQSISIAVSIYLVTYELRENEERLRRKK